MEMKNGHLLGLKIGARQLEKSELLSEPGCNTEYGSQKEAVRCANNGKPKAMYLNNCFKFRPPATSIQHERMLLCTLPPHNH